MKFKTIFILGMIVISAVIAVFFSFKKETEKTEPFKKTLAEHPAHAMLLVNDDRKQTFPTDMPIYVSLSVTNSPDNESLDLSRLKDIQPSILDSEKKEIMSKWTLLNRQTDHTIAPGHRHTYFWLLESKVPLGRYRITLDKMPGMFSSIKSRVLEISDHAGKEREKAYYQRRILIYKGDVDIVVKELNSLIKNNPDNASYSFELADALVLTGEKKEAKEILVGLVQKIQSENKEHPHPVPDWLIHKINRLSELKTAGTE